MKRNVAKGRLQLARLEDIPNIGPSIAADLLGQRSMLLNARRFPPDGDDAELVLLAIEDNTDHKRSEETNRTSEQRQRFILDSMPQKIFTVTPNGDVDYFNPQRTEFTGLPFQQIKGRGWKQFVHPDDLAETVRVWQHSIDTGEPLHQEHRFRRADGEYHWHVSGRYQCGTRRARF